MTFREKIEALFISRRFWAAVAGMVVVVAEEMGLGISPDTVYQIAAILIAWILGDSLHKTE